MQLPSNGIKSVLLGSLLPAWWLSGMHSLLSLCTARPCSCTARACSGLQRGRHLTQQAAHPGCVLVLFGQVVHSLHTCSPSVGLPPCVRSLNTCTGASSIYKGLEEQRNTEQQALNARSTPICPPTLRPANECLSPMQMLHEPRRHVQLQPEAADPLYIPPALKHGKQGAPSRGPGAACCPGVLQAVRCVASSIQQVSEAEADPMPRLQFQLQPEAADPLYTFPTLKHGKQGAPSRGPGAACCPGVWQTVRCVPSSIQQVSEAEADPGPRLQVQTQPEAGGP